MRSLYDLNMRNEHIINKKQAETQEIDFSGNLNVDYCAGTSSLYYIYYPDEDLVVSGTSVA